MELFTTEKKYALGSIDLAKKKKKRLAHFQVDETPNSVRPESNTDWPGSGTGEDRHATEGLVLGVHLTPNSYEAMLQVTAHL